MVEVNHHRIEVRRERYGLDAEGVRGSVVFPKSVDEAVSRLRSVEERQKEFRRMQSQQRYGDEMSSDKIKREEENEKESSSAEPTEDISRIPPFQPQIPAYELGRLVHRTEPELKTHTSYLVFAILPRAWSEEDEQKCRQAWPSRGQSDKSVEEQKTKRQLKKEARAKKQQQISEAQTKEEDLTEESKTAMDVDE